MNIQSRIKETKSFNCDLKKKRIQASGLPQNVLPIWIFVLNPIFFMRQSTRNKFFFLVWRSFPFNSRWAPQKKRKFLWLTHSRTHFSLSLTTLHVTDQSNFSVWDRAYKAPCTTQEREIKKSGFLFSSFVWCCCCCRRNCRCCCCTPSRMRTLEPSRLGPRLQQQQQQRGKKERHVIRKKKTKDRYDLSESARGGEGKTAILGN